MKRHRHTRPTEYRVHSVEALCKRVNRVTRRVDPRWRVSTRHYACTRVDTHNVVDALTAADDINCCASRVVSVVDHCATHKPSLTFGLDAMPAL